MSASKTEKRDEMLTEAIKDHSFRLQTIISKMIQDQAEAEDILQEVFAEYMENYDLGGAIETLGSWLAKVAKNKVLDRFRKKKTQNNYQNMILNSDSNSEEIDPEDEIEREWLGQEIINAIELLPRNQRDVFIQHELEGKSFEQIAKETGVSINTLLSRKRYAMMFLRNHLKEIYDEYK